MAKRKRAALAQQNKSISRRTRSSVKRLELEPSSNLLQLPSEIVSRIVDLLPASAYLTVKFVCKRLNAATKRQDERPTKYLKDIFKGPGHR